MTPCPAPSCLTCEGRPRSDWAALGASELARLDRAKTHAVVAPGEVVFQQGRPCEGVRCVEAGLLALRKSDARGNALLVGLAHPRDTLGHDALFTGGLHATTAVALVESRVCTFARAALEAALEASPPLALRFLRRLSRDLRASDQARLDALTLPVRDRLARLLLGLADRYGRPAPGGGLEVDLPVARRDLAGLLGVRPESVARALRSLADAGLARARGRRLTIPSVDALLDALPDGG